MKWLRQIDCVDWLPMLGKQNRADSPNGSGWMELPSTPKARKPAVYWLTCSCSFRKQQLKARHPLLRLGLVATLTQWHWTIERAVRCPYVLVVPNHDTGIKNRSVKECHDRWWYIQWKAAIVIKSTQGSNVRKMIFQTAGGEQGAGSSTAIRSQSKWRVQHQRHSTYYA